MKRELNKSPIFPILPGEMLKGELKARGIKQSEFALMVDVRPSHLSEIIKGVRPISDQLALRIEEVLGIDAAVWIRWQALYTRNQKEIELLEITEQNVINELRGYNEVVDVRSILKRFGNPNCSNSEKLSFLTDKMQFPASAEMKVQSWAGGLWRKSEKVGMDSRMINTWANMARYAVHKIHPYGVYNKSEVQNLVRELVTIFSENNNTMTRVENTMDKFGIKFCVVDKVEKASVDGYSFMDDEIPAIVVTARIPKIDNLAFSVLHELGHHVLHIKNDDTASFISYDGTERDAIEEEADAFASEALIPATEWKKLPAMPVNNAFLLQRSCTTWAKEHGYNKWIVMGRVSHETGMYKFKSDKTRNIN